MEIKKTMALPQARDPQDVRQEQLGKLRNASKMYEQQFIGEMVRAMRGTVHRSDLLPESFGERIFRDQLDSQYVENWTQGGGVGLADMIYTQLKERYFPEQMQRLGPPQGPLPLHQQGDGTLKMHKKISPDSEREFLKMDIETKNDQNGEVGEKTGEKTGEKIGEKISEQSLHAPWSGKVLRAQTLEEGQKLLLLQHDDGLRSEIRFQGALESLHPGAEVAAGHKIGDLKGHRPQLSWSLWT